MQKRMIAKYKGIDARTGVRINPGDEIIYDTATRQAWITDDDEDRPRRARPYGSDMIIIEGREYFRNKSGRCIDAPCCGCCNI